jgi:hypothetical protein
VVIEAEPLHGGRDCPFAQQRVCNTERCATPAPTQAPTPAPTPAPTYQPSKPVVNVRGGDVITVEAARVGDYTDAGATCTDDVWGNLDRAVESSGTVDLYTPGTYHIYYSCRNQAGYASDTTIRTVRVVDRTCPTCTMATANGGVNVVVEASFPYVDPGASCADTLDGAVAVTVTNPVNVERPGTYFVTYSATDRHGNRNDGASCRGGGKQYVRRVKVVDTLKPVIALKMGAKLIHHGSVGDVSQSDVPHANPVKDWGYMDLHDVRRRLAEREEEQEQQQGRTTAASTAGWAFGGAAVVGAVGIALVAVSRRRAVDSERECEREHDCDAVPV